MSVSLLQVPAMAVANGAGGGSGPTPSSGILIWQGNTVSTEAYVVGDAVLYANLGFVCLVAQPIGSPPPTYSTVGGPGPWSPFASDIIENIDTTVGVVCGGAGSSSGENIPAVGLYTPNTLIAMENILAVGELGQINIQASGSQPTPAAPGQITIGGTVNSTGLYVGNTQILFNGVALEQSSGTYMLYLGAWAGAPTVYSPNDVVIYQSVAWVSLVGGNSGNEPAFPSTAFWQPLAPAAGGGNLPSGAVNVIGMNAVNGFSWQGNGASPPVSTIAYPAGALVYYDTVALWYVLSVDKAVGSPQPSTDNDWTPFVNSLIGNNGAGTNIATVSCSSSGVLLSNNDAGAGVPAPGQIQVGGATTATGLYVSNSQLLFNGAAVGGGTANPVTVPNSAGGNNNQWVSGSAYNVGSLVYSPTAPYNWFLCYVAVLAGSTVDPQADVNAGTFGQGTNWQLLASAGFTTTSGTTPGTFYGPLTLSGTAITSTDLGTGEVVIDSGGGGSVPVGAASMVGMNAANAYAWQGNSASPELSTVAYATGAVVYYNTDGKWYIAAGPLLVGSTDPGVNPTWVAIEGSVISNTELNTNNATVACSNSGVLITNDDVGSGSPAPGQIQVGGPTTATGLYVSNTQLLFNNLPVSGGSTNVITGGSAGNVGTVSCNTTTGAVSVSTTGTAGVNIKSTVDSHLKIQPITGNLELGCTDPAGTLNQLTIVSVLPTGSTNPSDGEIAVTSGGKMTFSSQGDKTFTTDAGSITMSAHSLYSITSVTNGLNIQTVSSVAGAVNINPNQGDPNAQAGNVMYFCGPFEPGKNYAPGAVVTYLGASTWVAMLYNIGSTTPPAAGTSWSQIF